MGKVKDKQQRVFDECYDIYQEHGMTGVLEHVAKQSTNPDYADVEDEYCSECCSDTPALNSTCLVCGQETKPHYFKLIHSGYNHVTNREEIEINCGENGKLLIYQDVDKLGFIVDVYGQNDLANTMTVWEEDMNPPDDDELLEESNDPNNFSDVEIEEYKRYWGQSHSEITTALGYPKSHAESDELLMVDYFWIEKDKAWYPKSASTYSKRDEAIADYLRLG